MSLKAYQKAQQRVETPREIEYRLFGQVTRALMDIQDLPRYEIARRMDALDWNRRVWSFMAADCANPDNELPENLRASIISLSLWVGRYSSEVMQKGEDVEPLIDINRTIMQGLASQIERQKEALQVSEAG
ncbi:flagellar biosynthesis regulator FlaF [Aquidulcibacter sp.]|jgi:flagellar protein FlaF|uniref:flagellar biosynthesis regulator FlaF n=1 Tax=Aquidulcibacter sp. TaxID=2052990 RepID=UPI0028A87653|nr:flagellar biosynthesis regulator FlaF [Aquidulcibacter sp.]